MLCSRYIRYVEHDVLFLGILSCGELEKRRRKGEGMFDSVIKLDSAFSDDVGGGRFRNENS